MFEKVNPSHPDKICDRIAGAIVDLGYQKQENPKVACEVLLGHGKCHIIIETSVPYTQEEIEKIVSRIAGDNIKTDLCVVPQDKHLANNQVLEQRCGDNGIFKGVRISKEEKILTERVALLYKEYNTDGKYIYDEKTKTIIMCQSQATEESLREKICEMEKVIINPLGDWTGGTDVDTGATNRKLGSDMGRAVTGGGLHGKDLSKADVSINIYMHLLANETINQSVECFCAIGDNEINVNGKHIPYKKIVEEARKYVEEIGGFEKLAEWGLIRPTAKL